MLDAGDLAHARCNRHVNVRLTNSPWTIRYAAELQQPLSYTYKTNPINHRGVPNLETSTTGNPEEESKLQASHRIMTSECSLTWLWSCWCRSVGVGQVVAGYHDSVPFFAVLNL